MPHFRAAFLLCIFFINTFWSEWRDLNPRPLGPELRRVCIIVPNVFDKCDFALICELFSPISPPQSNGIWVNSVQKDGSQSRVIQSTAVTVCSMVILYIMGQRPGKDGKMKQRLFEQKNEITIPAADLEQANLMGFDRLELHLLDQAAVVIPGEMTARELIEVGESLLKLTFSLVDVLLESCSDCDNCGQQKPCAFMTDRWPGADSKSSFKKGLEDWMEFSRLSPDMQKLLRERRMCLLNLEEKLLNEDWVYFNGCGDGEYAE